MLLQAPFAVILVLVCSVAAHTRQHNHHRQDAAATNLGTDTGTGTDNTIINKTNKDFPARDYNNDDADKNGNEPDPDNSEPKNFQQASTTKYLLSENYSKETTDISTGSTPRQMSTAKPQTPESTTPNTDSKISTNKGEPTTESVPNNDTTTPASNKSEPPVEESVSNNDTPTPASNKNEPTEESVVSNNDTTLSNHPDTPLKQHPHPHPHPTIASSDSVESSDDVMFDSDEEEKTTTTTTPSPLTQKLCKLGQVIRCATTPHHRNSWASITFKYCEDVKNNRWNLTWGEADVGIGNRVRPIYLRMHARFSNCYMNLYYAQDKTIIGKTCAGTIRDRRIKEIGLWYMSNRGVCSQTFHLDKLHKPMFIKTQPRQSSRRTQN
jgi:hypothetical protein